MIENKHPEKHLRLPEEVSLKEAFWYWLKLGFISFGGPAGQISIMHQELVEKRRWISEKRFLHALNYTMVLPGPEAQQLATYIGWLMHGVGGGLIAGALFVLPSLFILMALTWVYLVFGDVALVQGILYGIKPAVTAIVLFAAYRIGSKTLTNIWLKCIAVVAFVAIFFFNIAFPFIVIGAGLLAYVGSRFAPEKFIKNQTHNEAKSFGPALLGDHSLLPSHAVFSWKRVVSYCVFGLLLWLAAITVLIVVQGWENTLTQMAWFFTKAALLTFGGAYAVLPYVYQGGVEQYAWLTATQMIDGLALGETTPGPLIMVVAFIGFVGGWTQEIMGPNMQLAAGIAAASAVTFFTFLPSFLFIFVGGPAVEATRGDIKFTVPLTGITAAVVGVIVNLAIFFAYYVLWPTGIAENFLESDVDWFAAIIGVTAFIALYKYKFSIPLVIIVAGSIGMMHHLIG